MGIPLTLKTSGFSVRGRGRPPHYERCERQIGEDVMFNWYKELFDKDEDQHQLDHCGGIIVTFVVVCIFILAAKFL